MRRTTAPLLAAVALCAAAGTARAQRHTDTDQICGQLRSQTPIVDLYSFEVGPKVFEKFGHAMLCLTYPGYTPICFNYGVTDFSDPGGLVWGFMRAKQKFWVDGERLDSMMAFYGSPKAGDFALIPDGVPQSPGGCLVVENEDGSCGRDIDGEDRTIWRQRLPLSPDKARAVADKLCTDMEPEHRYYIYHHFKDNCTTRLRDLVDTIFDGQLRADSDHPYPLTFRQFGRRGLAQYELLIGVSDYITGRNLDHHPTLWQAMFHPDVLRAAIADKLGIQPELIYKRRGPPFATSGPSGRPWAVLLSILIVLPLVLVRWLGWRDRAAVAVASLPLILFGLLVWSIFFVVTIDWVRWNEAMVLFLPTDVVLPFLSGRRRQRYAQVRLVMVLLVSLFVAVGLFLQPLWTPILTAFLPLSLIAFDVPRPRRAKAMPAAAVDAAAPTAPTSAA